MRDALQRAWLRRGPLAALLWPVSLVYGALAALRRAGYRAGLLRSTRLPVPVVVVGNVVAGGAGKTPVVMALAEHLASRGIRAGVVSRGYGRRTRDCRPVRPGDDPRDTGDEPLLIATRCRIPVVVAPRRADAARALLAAHPRTQLIVCDDGLQHLALDRDVEIVVFDDRGAGNGWLLPAGPLREPWPRRADLVLRTAGARGIDGHIVERRLAPEAVRADGTRLPLAQLRGRPLHAVAGIASPQAFFAMLREAGLTLAAAEALPDHAAFDRAPAGEVLVCTEKDAAKLWRLRPDAWAVPLALAVAPAAWQALDALLAPRLSSGDGPQTA